MLKTRLAIVAIAFALAACGGGGGSSPAPSAGAGTTPGNASSTPQSVQVNMHIPGAATTSSTKRSPQFVASSTQGVLVTVYASSDTGHTTPLGSSATNVAPGSTACGGAQGARTCTISIPAPPGTDDFVFVTYDQPPSSGTTFPGNAHLLGTGTVKSQAITIATANVVNVTLGGAIAYLTSNPVVNSFAAGTGAHTYTYEVNAYDGAGDVIIGPYVDVNGNADPVTVTAVEVGGSGYTKVAVGAATPSTTATINSSTDVVTVSYNGLSGNGYYVNLNGAAASGQTVPGTFNPLYISSTSPAFTPGSNATIVLTTAGQSVTVNMFEANATTSNVNASNCTNVATVTQPTQGSSTQSFSVTGAAGGSCTIYINFAQANYTINVTTPNSTTANVVVPGSLLVYTADGTNGVGIRTVAGAQIGTIPTSITADTVRLDDAGNVYILSWATTGAIAKYTPSATGYPPTYTPSGATYTPTISPIGNVYVSGAGEVVALEENAAGTQNTFDVWDAGHTGAPSRTITVANPTGNLIFGESMAHNGNFYYAQYVPCSSNASLSCIQWTVIPPGSATPLRTFNETIVPQANQSNVYWDYSTVGPDGTLYVDEWTYLPGDQNAGLYIYPPSGPEKFVGVGATSPTGIGLDSTGNIFVANNNTVYDNNGVQSSDTAHTLNVLSPDGGTILRSASIAPGPYPMTVAPDGTAFVSTDLGTSSQNGIYSLPVDGALTRIDTLGGNAALYDGSVSTDAHARTPQSIGSGMAVGGNGGIHRR